MSNQNERITIEHISIGFKNIVLNTNFADCHQSLKPFGLKWGRGILIRGNKYLEAVTGTFGITHSVLKESLNTNEQTAGAFYYGYNQDNKTLYLEYASDNNFDFYEEKILDAIMNSLREENGPLRDFRIKIAN